MKREFMLKTELVDPEKKEVSTSFALSHKPVATQVLCPNFNELFMAPLDGVTVCVCLAIISIYRTPG